MGMIIQNGKVYSGNVEIKGAKIDTLWSGTASSAGDLNLTGNYDDYDLLIFFGYNTSGTTYTSVVFYKNALNVAHTNNESLLVVDNSTAVTDRRVFLKIVSRNKVTITSAESGSQLKSIVGIKLNDSAMINYHKYSTDEQVVGTWVDGKTLYEKTIPTNTAFGNSWTKLTEIDDVDCIVETTVIVNEGGNRSYGVRQGYFCEVSTVTGEEGFVMLYNSTGFNVTVKYVTIRYTKSS